MYARQAPTLFSSANASALNITYITMRYISAHCGM
nr:MAG TPA: hypothetical protein [Caudoviricetes sp.]